jgi:hypothetical protein
VRLPLDRALKYILNHQQEKEDSIDPTYQYITRFSDSNAEHGLGYNLEKQEAGDHFHFFEGKTCHSLLRYSFHRDSRDVTIIEYTQNNCVLPTFSWQNLGEIKGSLKDYTTPETPQKEGDPVTIYYNDWARLRKTFGEKELPHVE